MLCAYPGCDEAALRHCPGCAERFCPTHANPNPTLSLGFEHASDAHWMERAYMETDDTDIGDFNEND